MTAKGKRSALSCRHKKSLALDFPGHINEAIRIYRQTLRINPNDLSVKEKLEEILSETGNQQ